LKLFFCLDSLLPLIVWYIEHIQVGIVVVSLFLFPVYLHFVVILHKVWYFSLIMSIGKLIF
jgi:hypothetical protein